ncbi:MAG: c-type cytochrome [Woeseiaceae bacterium]
MYTLVVGALAAVCLGFFVLAMFVSGRTAVVFTSGSDEYQEAIAERLKPFGDVYMPGDDLAAGGPQVAPAAAAEPVKTAMTGPQVYNEACIACHGSGIGGAPKFGDAAAWAPRIEQGIDVLKQHAIEGFTGSTGYMPPKGGRADFSDQEIHDAVDYMVSEGE